MWEWASRGDIDDDDAKGSGAGDEEVVRWIEACHAPWLKKPEEVAGFIAQGLKGVKGRGRSKTFGGDTRSGWA
jgi:hypothetical protein